jgi:hypothetical protein
MSRALRNALWDRAVLIVFTPPALGYLGFLWQFVADEPTGVLRTLLLVLFAFALPVMALYGALLGTVAPVDQELGTVGFFIFTYLVAALLVWVARRGGRLVRGRRSAKSDTETTG